MAPIHHLKKLLEAQQLVEGKALVTTDMLLEILFAHLYDAMRDHTNAVADKLSRVERDMFAGKERLTIRTISSLSRSFLHLESALANHEESMEHFFETLIHHNLFNSHFPDRARRMLAERTHLSRIVRAHRAAGTELRETNIALLESKQNDIMKTLTTITVVVLPLELIAFILGMHLPGTPLEGDPNAFAIVMSIMLGITVCTGLYFVWKRWI
jgi:Mg2+ and Co2+ transporter CorA